MVRRALQASGFRGKVTLQRVQIADNNLQQVVEVVRNAAGQLADAFHLLRLPRSLIGGPSLGQIARNFGKTQEFAPGRLDRIDNDAYPKVGAILAHTPTFGLVLSLPCSHRQGLCRDPGRSIGRGIEDGKAPPQNLLGGVTLDAGCPLVPARDVPGIIQHEYRVVLHPIDEPLRSFQRAEENGSASSLIARGALNANILAEEAMQGDPVALHIYEEIGRWLGAAVARYIALYSPDALILGGSVLSANEVLFASIQSTLTMHVATITDRPVKIALAHLGSDAALIGASVALFQQHCEPIQKAKASSVYSISPQP